MKDGCKPLLYPSFALAKAQTCVGLGNEPQMYISVI